jgi:uncharacterized protein
MCNVSRHHTTVIIGSIIILLAACTKETSDTGTKPPTPSSSAAAKIMHPSWDADQNGVNDCENDGSCDHTIDYSQPRPTTTTQPTFDCTTVEAGSMDAIICQDGELSQLDLKLSEIYKTASAKAANEQPPLLQTEQHGWVKGRNECWKADDKTQCIKITYERRISELQARYQLVPARGPFHFQCSESAADELIVTFYESDTPTLIAERSDSTSLMHQVRAASGSKYEGRNESFWEHHGEARVVWGYDTPEFVCKTTP